MIYKKLLELQKRELTLSKNASNPFFKSKYLNLEKILDVYLPILSEMQIVAIHQTKDNKVITTLYDLEDGSKIESEFNLIWSDPQKLWSCITYAKRYNLWQLLNIVVDEDDDWNKASEKPQFWEKEFKELWDLFAMSGKEDTKNFIKEAKEKYQFSKAIIEKISNFVKEKWL